MQASGYIPICGTSIFTILNACERLSIRYVLVAAIVIYIPSLYIYLLVIF